ncbi:hypothetical protein WDC_1501 [Paucilactobacillus wasatchensis]|uniref:Uncharacterized protein n=1 Tax=Paucilactobacillus wasatchensis TaxID=1335616 RepID=A0A0D1A4U7_9LACO|nr:hypothetical protein WDC_1501 [Paucilactobacillus wasatchensis]
MAFFLATTILAHWNSIFMVDYGVFSGHNGDSTPVARHLRAAMAQSYTKW